MSCDRFRPMGALYFKILYDLIFLLGDDRVNSVGLYNISKSLFGYFLLCDFLKWSGGRGSIWVERGLVRDGETVA